MAKHDKNKTKGFQMNPEMQAASYMAGNPAFALKPIPPGDKGKGLRKMAASAKGADQVKDFGYDPASAMRPASYMGNLDNLRNERGVITPSAMRLDPGGFYKDFQVETPEYLKSAGYGYNPDQTYSFRYRDKDNKPYRTDAPLSQAEYDAGGYKLLSASYRPIQNKDVYIGTDTKGYNRQKPVTPNLPSSDMSQEEANRRNNPYIVQTTQFGNKDGNLSQKYTLNRVGQGFKPVVKFDDDGNRFKTFRTTGATSSFTTRPNKGGSSNVMTNFKNFQFENKYQPQTFNFTRTFRGSNDPITPKNPMYNTGVLGAKVSYRDNQDQKMFTRAMGPSMTNILKNLNYTSPKTGESKPLFKLRIN